jgi:chaperonin GroES
MPDECTLKPYADRVVVEPDEPISKTPGGLLLPDTAKKKTGCGTVLAIGPGRTTDAGDVVPMHSKVGDKVLCASYNGYEIEHEGKTLIVCRDEEILAKIS